MAIHVTPQQMSKILNNYNSINESDIKISENKECGMKNKLTDLNNYLFEQLERLNDDSLTEEEFKKEIARAKAVTDVSNAIINNANTALKGTQFLAEKGYAVKGEGTIQLFLGDSSAGQKKEIHEGTN